MKDKEVRGKSYSPVRRRGSCSKQWSVHIHRIVLWVIEQFVTSLSPIEPCVSHDSLLPKEDVNSSWPFAMYVRASSM